MKTEKKSVVEQVVEHMTRGLKLDEQACVVHSLAAKVAGCAERAQENAEYLAREFGRYAADCAEGRVATTTPVGSSAVTDLVRDAARFEAYREAFEDAFHLAFGKSFSAARAEMREVEKARVAS